MNKNNNPSNKHKGKYILDSTNFTGYKGVKNDLNPNKSKSWRSTILKEKHK